MRQKIVVTVMVALAGILLVVYTNAATGGWADTATPTATRVRFVTNTPAKTPAKTALTPTEVRTATPLISQTFAITFTPRPMTLLTGTPVPPLTAHTWNANVVIIQMKSGGGDGGSPLAIYAYPPQFIVYSDGRVFTYNNQSQIVTVQLSHTELCALLNTIDQYGFLDYDPKTYLTEEQINKQLIMGAGGTSITINSWRTKQGSFYALHDYIKLMAEDFQSCPECKASAPTVLPALWNTYLFLSRYIPQGLQVYQPDRLAVYAVEQRDAQPEDRLWPLKSPSLKQLYQKTLIDTGPFERLGDSVTLTGNASKTVFKSFEEANASIYNDSLWFSDGKDAYRVLERPLLPYQAPIVKDQYSIVIPDPSISIPPTTLSCQPSDGVLAMPQP